MLSSLNWASFCHWHLCMVHFSLYLWWNIWIANRSFFGLFSVISTRVCWRSGFTFDLSSVSRLQTTGELPRSVSFWPMPNWMGAGWTALPWQGIRPRSNRTRPTSFRRSRSRDCSNRCAEAGCTGWVWQVELSLQEVPQIGKGRHFLLHVHSLGR